MPIAAMDLKANSLTEGSLTKALVALAGPMFISAILQNAQMLIDLFWVGRLGSEAVAALAISGTIMMTLFPIVMGMSAGTVALVSRSVGAGDHEAASDAAGQSLTVGLLLGVVAGVLGIAASRPLCRLLGAGPDTLHLAARFLHISFAGSFTVFLLFVANSILQSAGNTVLPMTAMLLANALNIVLEPLFIYGLLGLPAMGVAGAALATVISQGLAAALVIRRLVRGVSGLEVRAPRWRLRGDLAWRILRIGLPSSGQMLSRSIMSLVLMRIVAFYGTSAVAAYGIGVRFHMILLMPCFALGNAAATLVGQNLGARKPARAQASAWLAVAVAAAILAGSAVALFAFAPFCIGFFDPSPPVVEIGVAFLRIASPFYVFAALGIVLGRALVGAGDAVGPMVTTIIGLWGIQVPLAIVLSKAVTPATTGIWWSIAVALAANGLMTAAWFQTGRWKTRRI